MAHGHDWLEMNDESEHQPSTWVDFCLYCRMTITFSAEEPRTDTPEDLMPLVDEALAWESCGGPQNESTPARPAQ
jgi:hypothetical protein